MHPLLAASEPALLADHLQAYGELPAAKRSRARWQRAALLQLLACAAVG
jgi:hypothetical protein